MGFGKAEQHSEEVPGINWEMSNALVFNEELSQVVSSLDRLVDMYEVFYLVRQGIEVRRFSFSDVGKIGG